MPCAHFLESETLPATQPSHFYLSMREALKTCVTQGLTQECPQPDYSCFRTAPNHKHKCPPTGAWISKLLYMPAVEYCSSLKKKQTTVYTSRWMSLNTLCRVEEARNKRPQSVGFHLHRPSRESKSTEAEGRLALVGGRQRVGRGLASNGPEGSF